MKKVSGTLRFLLIMTLVTAALTSCATTVPYQTVDFQPYINQTNPLPEWALDGGMYELTLRHFTPEGTFRAAIPKLDGIAELGIKTIWIMPFQPMGLERRKGTHGSPYCQIDHRGVDPSYGTLEDFHAFRDRVHELGMKLILDITLNHTAFDHPWTLEHPDWYERDANGEIMQVSDWFNDIASLDFSNQEVRDELRDIMLYWIEDQNLDGFRLDAVSFLPEDFWLWVMPQISAVKPVIFMAEAGEPMHAVAGYNLMYIYGSSNSAYYGKNDPMPILAETEMINYEESFGTSFLRYMTNHDDVGIGTPIHRLGSRAATEAMSVFTYSKPGVPMLFNGMEVGSTLNISIIDNQKIDWEEDPESREFFHWYFNLWAQEDALKMGNFIGYQADSPVVAFVRSYQDENIAVVVNPTDQLQEFSLASQWISGSTLDLRTNLVYSGEQNPVLEPYEYLMLKF